jgi:hypothetical protein
MATEDDLQPDRSPIFLSRYAEETEQPDIGKAWDIAIISSRILKASIVAVMVTAIGIAVLSVGDPVALVANVTDWWGDKPVLQPDADPPTSTLPSIASTQDSPPTTPEAPARSEMAAAVEPADQGAAAVEPADQSRAEVGQNRTEVSRSQAEAGQSRTEVSQSQAEVGQPVTEELFKQFQAWAAQEETPAGPAQAAPVRSVQEAAAQARPTKKPRRVRSVQNARAEIRPQRNQRARIRQEQDPQVPPVADPRAQDSSVQNGQPPSFLQSLGLRN